MEEVRGQYRSRAQWVPVGSFRNLTADLTWFGEEHAARNTGFSPLRKPRSVRMWLITRQRPD